MYDSGFAAINVPVPLLLAEIKPLSIKIEYFLQVVLTLQV